MNKLNEFTEHLNKRPLPIIKQTVEKEKNTPFLDVNVIRGNQCQQTSEV